MENLSKFNQAITLYKQGQLSVAAEICEDVLKVNHSDCDALNLLGLIAYKTNNAGRAVDLFSKAIKVNPVMAAFYSNLALAFQQLKQPEKALDNFNKAIALKSDFTEAFCYRGNLLLEVKNFKVAIESYDRAIKLKPNYHDAHYGRGLASQGLEKFNAAIESYKKASEISPSNISAYLNLGFCFQALKQPNLALESFNQVLALNPNYAPAYNNRGVVLISLNRLDEALVSLDKALLLDGNYAEAYFNKGLAFQEAKQLSDALAMYEKCLQLSSGHLSAYNNRAVVLSDLGQFESALLSFDKAIALNPKDSLAYFNKGNTLQKLRRFDDALASYDKAMALLPNFAGVYFGRGNVQVEMGNLEAALVTYAKALVLNPDYAEVYHNRGFALIENKQLEAGLVDYLSALSIKPDYEFLYGSYLNTKMMLCDWTSLDEDLKRLETDILQGKKVSFPFPVLGLIDSPKIHQDVAELYSGSKYPGSQEFFKFNLPKLNKHRKIRIGYYSADFHAHATAYLMAELFEAHDSEMFEIYAFSFGVASQDAMRGRLSSAFFKFFEVKDKSDNEIAAMSRRLEIDIAVDLKGHTQNARPGIFAERCAPIQINYLGYPGTSGAKYFDYVIADKVVVTPENQEFFTEKVIYLPNSYQVNDSKRKISDKLFTRLEHGLPKSGFVFCCFNNNYKILPETFDMWVNILKKVKGSILWLLEDNATAANNLRKEAELRGLDSNRLVFAKRVPLDEHLARHQLADLFLDTFPYNAHTTASDALWAGLPVLTMPGKSFASRVAASLLTAVDMPELIANNAGDFENIAILLANDSVKLKKLKAKLVENTKSASLFNGKLFANHIESAYKVIFQRHQAGLAPDAIEITP